MPIYSLIQTNSPQAKLDVNTDNLKDATQAILHERAERERTTTTTRNIYFTSK